MASKSSITYKRLRPNRQHYSRFVPSGNKIQEESFATSRLESLRSFHSSQSTRTRPTGIRWNSSNHRHRRSSNNNRRNSRQEQSSHATDRFHQNQFHQSRRDSNKPSPATLLMDQWENSSSSSGQSPSSYNANVQRKRFQERQEALCQAIVQYRNQWFETDDTNIATEWKHAVQFQHPTFAVDAKEKLIATEEVFGQICALCHDFFVTTALLAETELTGTQELDKQQQKFLQRQLQQQQNAIDVLTCVLPFWETMRKDRAVLVEQVLKQEPPPETNEEPLKETKVNVHDDLKAVSPPAKEEGGKRNWVTWIKTMVVGDDDSSSSNNPSTVPVPSSPPTLKKQLGVSSLMAHDDVQYAPNHYHYNKLVGRLYFSYPPLVALQAFQDEDNLGQDLLDMEGDDEADNQNMDGRQRNRNNIPKQAPDQDTKLAAILEQRATQIQSIFDQVPNTVPVGKGGMTVRSPVLTDKMVRLLIRAYQDTGTLDAAYKTEQVYYKYPSHRRGMLWFVLMSYLQVTEKHPPTRSSSSSSSSGGDNPDTMGFAQQLRQTPKKFSPKSASLATKRVCELLSKQVQQSNMNPNELHSCATIGFQCLANIAVPSLDRYYDRVHALATLKFGAKTWEALLSSKPNIESLQQQLRPKDSVSMQLLIQIYAKGDGTMVDLEDVHMEKAMALLDNMWKCCSLSELQDSIERSTFHSLLDALNKRRKRRKRNRDESASVSNSKKSGAPVFDNQEDFDYALTLFDKMIAHEVWYPNEETFQHLYRLAEYGPQADEVSVRLELCRAILQEYPLSPYLASKHALRAWSDTAQQEALLSDNDAERRIHGDDEKAAVAMERAFQIFQQLQTYSSPLLYNNAPHKIAHVYNVRDVPTSLSYGLVWQSCYYTAQNHAASAATKQRAVDIAKAMYLFAQEHPETVLRPKSHRMLLQCLSLSTNDQERLEFAQDVFTKSRQTSSTLNRSMEPLLLEALLDCLVNTSTTTTTAATTSNQISEDRFQQQRQELIQQVYNEVVSTHDMPVMSDRFLTLLGRVHPELHQRLIADQQQQHKKE